MMLQSVSAIGEQTGPALAIREQPGPALAIRANRTNIGKEKRSVQRGQTQYIETHFSNTSIISHTLNVDVPLMYTRNCAYCLHTDCEPSAILNSNDDMMQELHAGAACRSCIR